MLIIKEELLIHKLLLEWLFLSRAIKLGTNITPIGLLPKCLPLMSSKMHLQIEGHILLLPDRWFHQPKMNKCLERFLYFNMVICSERFYFSLITLPQNFLS